MNSLDNNSKTPTDYGSPSAFKDDEDLLQDSIYSIEESTSVSMETHLPESNVGYKLLLKMGWTAGKGLGLNGQGRIDPIRIELKDDSLGVGKAEEYSSTHISSTSKRKTLDSEKQMEETELQRNEREQLVEKKQAIQKELEQVKKAFYCELCDKQYKKISEFEQHLQSYDHHHKKRFKDMKESTRNTSASQLEREKRIAREKKRDEREMKRMQEAMQKKLGDTSDKSQELLIPASSVIKKTGVVASSTGGGWVHSEHVNHSNTSPVVDKGGWSTSSLPVSSNTMPLKTNKTELKSIPNLNTEPITLTNSSNEPPKKLSFGLKKTNAFQFGLKKK